MNLRDSLSNLTAALEGCSAAIDTGQFDDDEDDDGELREIAATLAYQAALLASTLAARYRN